MKPLGVGYLNIGFRVAIGDDLNRAIAYLPLYFPKLTDQIGFLVVKPHCPCCGWEAFQGPPLKDPLQKNGFDHV